MVSDPALPHSSRGRENLGPAEGVPVPYDGRGRRLWPGLEPGPQAETLGRPRPAYLVDGKRRLVVEQAVLRWEEIAHTWPPAEARALWEDPRCREERQWMYEDCGFEEAVLARMKAAKRVMLARVSDVEARADGSSP